MIKSIIKRVIIGVSIALILGAIGSCEVKAVSKAVTYTNVSAYSNNTYSETALNTSAHSFSIGNLNYAAFTSVAVDNALNYLRGNVSLDDNTAFSSYDYFSFTVLSDNVEVGAFLYYGLRSLPCNVTTSSLLASSTGHVRNYAHVVECSTSGVDNTASSVAFHVYLNYPTSSSYNVYLSKRYHFYNDPISSKLSSILSAINTSNDKLDDIIDELSNTNSALSLIATRLQIIQSRIESGNLTITNAVNNTTNAVTNMDNTIKDDDTSSVNTDAISSAKNNVASNNVISNLVLLPVNLFTKILNSTSASCSSFNLGQLYGEDLILPCIVLSDYLGSSLVNVIDVLISGLFIYHISRKMVKVFEELSSLRNGGNDV